MNHLEKMKARIARRQAVIDRQRKRDALRFAAKAVQQPRPSVPKAPAGITYGRERAYEPPIPAPTFAVEPPEFSDTLVCRGCYFRARNSTVLALHIELEHVGGDVFIHRKPESQDDGPVI